MLRDNIIALGENAQTMKGRSTPMYSNSTNFESRLIVLNGKPMDKNNCMRTQVRSMGKDPMKLTD